eukprot:269598_1
MGIQLADITINNTNTIRCHAPNQPESIIYYLAGGNQQADSTNCKQSNQSNSQNNNSENNNNSSQNNNSGNNNGNNMSGSDGANNGGNGNGRNNKNNKDSNEDDKNEDDKDEDDKNEDDEEEENDNEDNDDDDQKDKQSNKSTLNPMAQKFVPHNMSPHISLLNTINEDELLVTNPSVLIQSAATISVFINERKEETNVKSSNVDQYADDRQQNKKQKRNVNKRKKLTFKQKKKLKLQQMYIRVNNQPYYDIIETAKKK